MNPNVSMVVIVRAAFIVVLAIPNTVSDRPPVVYGVAAVKQKTNQAVVFPFTMQMLEKHNEADQKPE